jgi:hypothetical protein
MDRLGLPPQIPEFFTPFRGTRPAGAFPVYVPRICGLGEVFFGAGQKQLHAHAAEIGHEAVSVNWEEAQPAPFDETQMDKEPAQQAEFAPLAAAAAKPENYKAWSREFAAFLYRTAQIEFYRSPEFKLTSNPGEPESDFRVRVGQLAREKRDNTVEALRRKYGPKLTALEDRIRRAEQRVEKEKNDIRQAGVQTAVSLGATLLGAFLGRKTLSAGTIGRASTTIRSGMRTAKENQDIAAASDNLEVLRQQRAELEAAFNAELQAMEGSAVPLLQKIETVAQRPKKQDVTVRFIGLGWFPHWKASDGKISPAY